MEKINDRYTQITSGAQLVNLFLAGESVVYMQGDSALPADFGRPALKMIHEAEQGKYYVDTKPKKQEVDMEPFLRNGLDVCFGDRPDQCYFVGTLESIHKGGQLVDLYQDNTASEWKYCQPRLNHPFIWTPDIELPEGLVVEYCWDRTINRKPIWRDHNPFGSRSSFLVVARIIDKKDGYCFPGDE